MFDHEGPQQISRHQQSFKNWKSWETTDTEDETYWLHMSMAEC